MTEDTRTDETSAEVMSPEAMGGQMVVARQPPRRGGSLALADPMAMLDFAIRKGQGVEVIKQLMDLQERWQKSEALRAFNNAIADAKAEFPRIIKNSHVTFEAKDNQGKAADKKDRSKDTDYWHETLDGIADQIDPILHKFGLGYRFETGSTIGPANDRGEVSSAIKVTCVVFHRDGHEVRNSLDGPRDTTGSKNAHQAIASALTYLQRYALKAALGLSAARRDDDGRAAGLTTLQVESQVDRYRRQFELVSTVRGMDELKGKLEGEDDDVRQAVKPHYQKARDRLAGPRRAPAPDEAAAVQPDKPIDPLALYQRAPNIYLDVVRDAVKRASSKAELTAAWDRLVEPVKNLLADADYNDEIIPGFDARGAALESSGANEEGVKP